MEIVEKDFKLTPISEDHPSFDLELLYVVNKGKSNERLEFKNAAYGISIETAIRKIAHYRISCKHKDEAIKLKTYFSEFKQELDNLKNLLSV